MTTQTINPPKLHDPTGFGYSHAAFAPTGSELVYIGGQYASDENGHTTSEDFSEQVAQSFANLGTVLRAAGVDYSNVIRLGTFIVAHDGHKLEVLVNAVQGIWGNNPPAQTLVGVASLALPDMLFEVDAIAVRA
jgi:enamine deaminase RidA (YjgF/YER057c/UK114 family)